MIVVTVPEVSGSFQRPANPGIASWLDAGGLVVDSGAEVGVGVGMRELHEQAMITIPAMAPIRTSQNFLRISICFLLF
jgi:hypothetical protein